MSQDFLHRNSDKAEVVVISPHCYSKEVSPYIGTFANNIKTISKNLSRLFGQHLNFDFAIDLFHSSHITMKYEGKHRFN